jgi:hypothetical protein
VVANVAVGCRSIGRGELVIVDRVPVDRLHTPADPSGRGPSSGSHEARSPGTWTRRTSDRRPAAAPPNPEMTGTDLPLAQSASRIDSASGTAPRREHARAASES